MRKKTRFLRSCHIYCSFIMGKWSLHWHFVCTLLCLAQELTYNKYAYLFTTTVQLRYKGYNATQHNTFTHRDKCIYIHWDKCIFIHEANGLHKEKYKFALYLYLSDVIHIHVHVNAYKTKLLLDFRKSFVNRDRK